MNLVPLTFELLLAGVILVVFVADLLLPATEKRGLGALAAAGLVGVLALTFVVDAGGTTFGGAYTLDQTALFLKRVFLAAGAIGVMGAIDHCDRRFPTRQGEYYLLLMMSLLGMMLLSGARELVLLVVAFELMGIPLYVLAAMAKDPSHRTTEAALKFFLVGATSSVISLWGLSLIYGTSGTTMISGLADATMSPLFAMGIMGVIAGMAFKIGLVPFHMWVPDTYEGAPTPFVAFLSVAPKAAGFAALIRIFMGGLMGFQDTWLTVLLVLCGVTMAFGNVLAIPQSNVKRLLAGSGIAHVGYMLLAFAIGTVQGMGMLLFYLAAYVFTNMGAFMVQEVLAARRGSDDIGIYRGLARTAPALALVMLVFLLSLGGIPFVVGFWAKIYVFVAAWDAHQYGLVILGAALAVMALFYYLKVARAMYIEAPDAEHAEEDASPMGMPTRLALLVTALGVVGMGVYPRPFIEAALSAAQEMFTTSGVAGLM